MSFVAGVALGSGLSAAPPLSSCIVEGSSSFASSESFSAIRDKLLASESQQDESLSTFDDRTESRDQQNSPVQQQEEDDENARSSLGPPAPQRRAPVQTLHERVLVAEDDNNKKNAKVLVVDSQRQAIVDELKQRITVYHRQVRSVLSSDDVDESVASNYERPLHLLLETPLPPPEHCHHSESSSTSAIVSPTESSCDLPENNTRYNTATTSTADSTPTASTLKQEAWTTTTGSGEEEEVVEGEESTEITFEESTTLFFGNSDTQEQATLRVPLDESCCGASQPNASVQSCLVAPKIKQPPVRITQQAPSFDEQAPSFDEQASRHTLLEEAPSLDEGYSNSTGGVEPEAPLFKQQEQQLVNDTPEAVSTQDSLQTKPRVGSPSDQEALISEEDKAESATALKHENRTTTTTTVAPAAADTITEESNQETDTQSQEQPHEYNSEQAPTNVSEPPPSTESGSIADDYDSNKKSRPESAFSTGATGGQSATSIPRLTPDSEAIHPVQDPNNNNSNDCELLSSARGIFSENSVLKSVDICKQVSATNQEEQAIGDSVRVQKGNHHQTEPKQKKLTVKTSPETAAKTNGPSKVEPTESVQNDEQVLGAAAVETTQDHNTTAVKAEALKKQDIGMTSQQYEEEKKEDDDVVVKQTRKTTTAVPTKNTSVASKESPATAESKESTTTSEENRPKKKLSEYIRRDLWTRSDPSVVEEALKVVAEAANKQESRGSIARAGGLLAVVRAMEDNINHAGVQIAACRAFERLALDPENEMAIAEIGGIDAILGAMMGHFESEHVHEAAWSALWNLTCLNAAEKMTLDTPGGLDALVSCMKLHVNHAGVQKNACGALANLCMQNEERLQSFVHAGGIVAISTALQKHWNNPDVRQEASHALTVLLQPSGLHDEKLK